MTKAIIIGGGIAGLSAAIALRKADYDVVIYEQAAALQPMGAALSLWGNAMLALEWLGVEDRLSPAAAAITHLGAFQQDGRPILRLDIAKAYGTDLPQPRLPTRSLLQSVLLVGLGEVDLRLDHTVVDVVQSSDRASVSFTNGMRDEADLIVIADGIWSRTGSALVGTSAAHAGYGGVLALCDAVPGASPPGMAAEYWGRGERFGLFDLGGDRCYWFFMRNEATSAQTYAMTMIEIEAGLDKWPAGVDQAVRATPADRLIPFSIHAKPVPKRLGEGRFICVGDAAHAMEPNLGQGGCQSLEDAMALGRAAQISAPGDVLRNFEAMRLKRIGQFVRGSRQANFVAQSHYHRAAQWARAAMALVPDRLPTRQFAQLHRLPASYGIKA